MKIVFAPDSFKDSLSASRVSGILRKKAEEIFTKCTMQEIPLADGDKGTVDVLLSVLGGRREWAMASNFMGEPIEVEYGVLPDGTAVAETGPLLCDDGRQECSTRQKMLFSSSSGVGELIGTLLDRGYRKIYIGAGAGMTNDGGMGCAKALGVRFLDQKGEELGAAGFSLKEIRRIDTTGLDPRLSEAELTVMCAVNNVLVGDQGATYVYGAMNGGGPEELIRLEHGMRNYAQSIEETTGLCVSECSGAGAAGGLPAALKAFGGAKLRSGISSVLQLIHFEELINDASLVVVGEGTLDRTSIYGKAISGIGMLCKAKKIPVVAVVGQMGQDAELLYHYGVSSMISSVNTIMEQEDAIENAERLIGAAAERMFRLLAVGMEMQNCEAFFPDAGVELRVRADNQGRIHWAVDPEWDD